LVALTPVGKTIILHVRAILTHAETIEQEAKATAGHAIGKLRIGTTTPCLSPGVFACLLTTFQREYPEVEVVLFDGSLQEVGEWLEGNVIDVGFVPLPASEMDSTFVTTDELCIVVPSNHALSTQNSVRPIDLYEEAFIMSKGECSLQLMERVGLEPSRTRSMIRYQASDSNTILTMIREGLGVTLIPRMMLPKKLDGVVALSLYPPQPLQIGLAIRSRKLASPAAKLFVETARLWTQTQHNIAPDLLPANPIS
jgi:DNA-binding transcriptional LysR family regulator